MRYRISALLTFLLVFILGGCVTPFYVACLKAASDPNGKFKYTEDKARVACSSKEVISYAYPHLLVRDKEKNTWELNPNGVLTEHVEGVLRDQVRSLNSLLSYQDREGADFIDFFKGFREGLGKEEAIALELLRRLNYVKTYNEFTDLVGELSPDLRPKELAYFFPVGRKFYSMRVLYPRKSLKNISFTAEYLEVAKRDGNLKLVDTFDVAGVQEFAKKIPDLYDPNDFTWEKQTRGWSVRAYKVLPDKEKPNDSVVHYIEIFRMKKDSQGIESHPAARGFLASGGSKVTVFVLDYDREDMPGYGSPDSVVRMYTDISGTKDIFFDATLREKLLLALYETHENTPSDRPERKKPKEKKIYTSIVELGKTKIDMWEKGTWSVPFDYRVLTQNLEFVLGKPTPAEEKNYQASKDMAEREKLKLKQIKALRREFKQESNTVVVEYWIPKPEYAERNIASAFALSDTIRIRRKNGPEETGEVGYFGKQIRAIDYQFGGRWFRILDEDGDGIFEKRRAISNPVAESVSFESSANQSVLYPFRNEQ